MAKYQAEFQHPMTVRYACRLKQNFALPDNVIQSLRSIGLAKVQP